MHPDPAAIAPISAQIWDRKYRFKAADGTPFDHTVADTWQRVARAAAVAERGGRRERERWAERFHEGLSGFVFVPAGRIIAGAGTERLVTLFNCFVMGRIEDDLGAIFENVKEAALTMQQGGGIGHDFSTLRPRGAPVRSIGADASGPVSFMDVWDAMCRTIQSAGARRGAMMGTLRCDHPDIEEFIAAKADARRLRNFNLSVLVTDAFLAAVRDDRPWPLQFAGRIVRTVPARGLWERIMRATYDYAEPGVIFIDRVNALNNLAYCEEIHATNPCVTGDTWVHTTDGPRQVAELIGKPFTALVNGNAYPSGPIGFFSTGRKPVFRLTTREGFALRLTANHPVLKVVGQTRYRVATQWTQAGQLAAGDRIAIHRHRNEQVWSGRYGVEEGYLLGLLVGDGTLKSDKAVLSVWRRRRVANGDEQEDGAAGIMDTALAAARRLPHRSDFVGWIEVPGRNEFRLASGALRHLALEFGMTPGKNAIGSSIERESFGFYVGFLRGLFDTDGTVLGSQEKGVSIRLAQSDLARLEAVQRMLLRLGIASTIYRQRRPAGVRLLPDGKGGKRLYECNADHELVISNDNIGEFATTIGFADLEKSARLARLLTAYRRTENRERFVVEVAAVELDGEAEVFDVQVPGVNSFDANGLVVHNCGEQPLPSYGACLLGSINLARLVVRPFERDASLDLAKLEEHVRLAVRFLDNIIDVSGYPLAAQKKEAKAKRRIGLGVTGLADALIFLGVRYDSPRALALAESWTASLERVAYLASAELAAEKGAFPLYDAEKFRAAPNVAALDAEVRAAIGRHGIRNGCLTSIAPTGTISLFAGNVSSGVEPVFDFVYRRRVLEATGAAQETTVEDYAHALFRRRFGDGAPLGEAFVTAAELAPRAHLEMQAALQRHVDSSIAKTINCPADISFADFKDVYLEAYELGLKGCTTFRPNAVTGAVLSSAPAPTETPPAVREPATEGNAPRFRAVAPAAGGGRNEAAAEVVYMVEPLERDAALSGVTYKLRWPGSDHALYVTINDIERDGRRRPFEIFINTKNLEHYAWTVALTRMISAVFRRGGDVSFVVEELKAIFDPQGGHWLGGRYVPSLIAAIGQVIETHMIRTGFLPHGTEQDQASPEERQVAGGAAAPGVPSTAPARRCPRCGSPSLVRQEGCWVCRDCDYSRCA